MENLVSGNIVELTKQAIATYWSWKRLWYNEDTAVVDPMWVTVDNFLIDMGLRPKGTVLSRKDESKPYSKENCEWVTRSTLTKRHPRSGPKDYTYKGEDMSLREISKRVNIPYTTLYKRVNHHGMSVELAVSFPPMQRVKRPALQIGNEA